MLQSQKEKIHTQSQEHILQVGEHIQEYAATIASSIQALRDKLQKGDLEDPEVLVTIIIHRLETQKQLEYAYKSPYFIRCDVLFDDEKELKTLFFGRFPFTKDAIYSWVAPAAAIRFEPLGTFSYTLPSGEKRTGKLVRKDQFMIVDRRIVFLSSESTDYDRELIYQEYFSERKSGFVLQEIVEQMERAQDTIIRSHYFGSFLISGAAGSGKTTLALHRVAFLAQSPETSELFKPQQAIVFVQDTQTKNYFSNLLPELGIYRVKIITFDEWAQAILNLSEKQFVTRFGDTEEDKDTYEYMKKKALDAFQRSTEKNIFTLLKKAYENFWSPKEESLWKKQVKMNLVDRFDLTILMKNKLLQEEKLEETVEKYVLQKSTRKHVKRKVKQPISYAVMVLDEAENYLSEQITILKSCVDPKTNAVIYVGDLQQQTHLWTIRAWTEVKELFDKNRQVILQKVYRNSKQILEYLQSLGYTVHIPSTIREGNSVVEKRTNSYEEEFAWVHKSIGNEANISIGIVAKTVEYLKKYKDAFKASKNVHVLTINEAQGVEFDSVFLVGVNKELYTINSSLPGEVMEERRRVNSDLLYVALTRATNNLFVSGNSSIKEILV